MSETIQPGGGGSAAARLRRFLGLDLGRSYVLFSVVQGLYFPAYVLGTFVLSSMVVAHTVSPLALAAILAVPKIPAVLIGGILADRFNRKTVVVLTALLAAAACWGLSLLLRHDQVSLPVIVLAVFVLSGSFMLLEALCLAMAPAILAKGGRRAEEQVLVRGNMRTQVLWGISRAGLRWGAAALYAESPEKPFEWGAAVALVLAVAAMFVRIPKQSDSSALDAEALAWLKGSAAGRMLAHISILTTAVLAIPIPMTVLLVQGTLGLSPTVFGMTATLSGVGAVLGAVLARGFSRRLDLTTLLVLVLVVDVPVFLIWAYASVELFGWTGSVVATSIGYLLLGMVSGVYMVTTVTMQQSLVPEKSRVRVAAVIGSIASMFSVPFGLAGGAIAASFGLAEMFLVSAALMLVVTKWLHHNLGPIDLALRQARASQAE